MKLKEFEDAIKASLPDGMEIKGGAHYLSAEMGAFIGFTDPVIGEDGKELTAPVIVPKWDDDVEPYLEEAVRVLTVGKEP